MTWLIHCVFPSKFLNLPLFLNGFVQFRFSFISVLFQLCGQFKTECYAYVETSFGAVVPQETQIWRLNARSNENVEILVNYIFQLQLTYDPQRKGKGKAHLHNFTIAAYAASAALLSQTYILGRSPSPHSRTLDYKHTAARRPSLLFNSLYFCNPCKHIEYHSFFDPGEIKG